MKHFFREISLISFFNHRLQSGGHSLEMIKVAVTLRSTELLQPDVIMDFGSEPRSICQQF